jgi:hypothetical protein
MVIEKDARRFVVQAISLEKNLQQLEKGETHGDLMEVKRLLIEKINDINPVTNVNGKGRNDFKIDVLTRCEELLRQKNSSAAVKKLAD